MPSEIVDRILHNTFDLPMYLRQGYIAQCMRLLVKKAAVMIHYVEAYKKAGEGEPSLDWSIVKRMTKDLDITNESDLSVVLGIAAKMQPGIYVAVSGMVKIFLYSFLTGDPASLELKFMELFESF